MKMTTSFDRGVKNAKRYLRNLTTKEIALSDKDAVQSQFRKVNSSANETLFKCFISTTIYLTKLPLYDIFIR